MVKQPGHLTSMKNDRGAGTRVLKKLMLATEHIAVRTASSYLELVLAGLGLRSRVEKVNCESLEMPC